MGEKEVDSIRNKRRDTSLASFSSFGFSVACVYLSLLFAWNNLRVGFVELFVSPSFGRRVVNKCVNLNYYVFGI